LVYISKVGVTVDMPKLKLRGREEGKMEEPISLIRRIQKISLK
jgi:hypothetical protein